MHVFVQSRHRYPARVGGPGGGRVFDCLVKGLAELGHEVSYLVQSGIDHELTQDVSPNITFVNELVPEADIYHLRSDSSLATEMQKQNLPWVATCHVDLEVHNKSRTESKPNWIYVSRHLAKTYGSPRFVTNGVDPSELTYAADKQDYLLFVSALPLARRKGLDKAIWIAREVNLPLVVAGGVGVTDG